MHVYFCLASEKSLLVAAAKASRSDRAALPTGVGDWQPLRGFAVAVVRQKLLQRDYAQRLNPRGKQRDGNACKAGALRRRHPSLGTQKEWKSNLALVVNAATLQVTGWS
jgi:hypothetical protein